MEFIVPRNDLAIAVTHSVHGIPNNPVIPVRAGMHIKTFHDGISFHGSDGDVTFTSSVHCSPELGSSGESVTIPGRLLADVVKTLPDKDIHFGTDDLTATLTCGRIQFKFPVYPEEYPDLPVMASKGGHAEADVFTEAVRKVIPAASKSDSNPVLASIYLEPSGDTLWAVCTDKFRLAAVRMAWKPMEQLQPVLIPFWAADRFTRAVQGPVTLGWDDRVVTMESDPVQVTSRRLAGEWPSGWRNLLPDVPCTVEVNTEALQGALRRAQLATGPEDAPVELTFTDGRLHVEAGYGNHADDVLDTSYSGEEFRALFGIRLLTDGLDGCGPVVRFGWSGKFVYLESGAYTYTVVPRRKI